MRGGCVRTPDLGKPRLGRCSGKKGITIRQKGGVQCPLIVYTGFPQ
jgi:hypothetical protein